MTQKTRSRLYNSISRARVRKLGQRGRGSNPSGRTLHDATENGHNDVVRFLLRSGADVNVKDFRGLAPLHRAVQAARATTVESLLARGAAVNAKTQWGATPLLMLLGG